MSNFQIAIEVNAPPERVWRIMSDIDHWHEWTESVTSVRRINDAPFAVGTRAVVKQPKFPPAVWKVTSIERGSGFTWESRAPGMRVVGIHRVEPTPDGSRVTLSLDYYGILGGLFASMTRGITERYIALEANGLKKRSESRS